VRIEEAESHRIPLHWKTAKGKTVPQTKANADVDGKILKGNVSEQSEFLFEEMHTGSLVLLEKHLYTNRTQNRHRLTG